ncbi:TIR domain-containing protein [Egbenema bharatensis]|uniref:TIR domain-containing protein n=1 Tax=Egbenema bharatensis TaxID=3463334 RepID=UPI003A868A02
MIENSEPIYNPRENDIFIAYSPEDDFFAKRLEKAIIKLGRDPWIDTQDLPPGLKSEMPEAWNHIEVGIKNADVFVLIISPASIALQRNQQELKLAAQYRKRLVPIAYQPVDPTQIPACLAADDVTWLTVDPDDPTAQIEETAKTILHIHIHQRLLMRALVWDQQGQSFTGLLAGTDLEAVQQWFDENTQRQPHLTELQQIYLTISRRAEARQDHLKQLDVFVSYSRRDREFAEALCDQLKQANLNIWVDWENIPIAADWRQEIQEGIEAAHTFLFIISPDSVASPYCHDEVTQAVSNNKRVISIVYRQDYDRIWFNQVPALSTIRRHNWLHCHSLARLEHTTPKLIHAINTDLDYVKAHTRLLLQAIEWKTQERREEFLLRKTELSNAQALIAQGRAIGHQWHKLSATPLPTPLQEEFVSESARVEAAIEQQERKRLQRLRLLAGAVIVFLGLSVSAIAGQVQAQNRQIEALVSSIEGVRELDALINGLRAGQELDRWGWIIERLEPDLRVRVVTALQQQVYNLRELNRLEGHEDQIFNTSISPDGRLIASASADGTVRLWDGQGQPIQVLNHRQETGRPSVVHVSFNPGVESGTYTLVSAGDGQTVSVWKIKRSAEGRWTAQLDQELAVSEAVRAGSFDRIFSLSFSQGGQILAAASSEGTVTLWRRNSAGQFDLAHRIELGDRSAVLSLGFSQSERGEIKLAAANIMGLIQVFTSRDGFQTYATSPPLQHGARVLHVAFSPYGRTIASAGDGGVIKLWSPDTGEQPIQELIGHEGTVNRVAFSPDDRTIASVGEDGSVRLWSRQADNWQGEVALNVLRGHRDPVYRVQFTPRGDLIATASADDSIRLWSLDGTLLDTLEGHQDEVLGIEFSRNNRVLVSSSKDKTLRLWKIDNPIRVLPHNYRVYDLSFTPDGMMMASSGQNTIRLWRTSDGAPLLAEPIQQDGIIHSISFAPRGDMSSSQGQLLAATRQDGMVNLWKLQRSEAGYAANPVSGEDIKHDKNIYSIDFSANGQILASAGGDGTVKIWELQSTDDRYSATLLEELRGLNGAVRTVRFSPNGRMLAAAGDAGIISVWQLEGQGEDLRAHLLHSMTDHGRTVRSVSFSPNSQSLASASEDGTVRLWHLEGTMLQSRVLRGHSDAVLKVEFSPTGRYLASASQDDTVKLWTIEGTPITTLREHRREVSSIAFSPDGQTLASSSYDARALLWQLSDEFDLAAFLSQGCTLAHDYLLTSQYSVGMSSAQYQNGLKEVQRLCNQLVATEDHQPILYEQTKESDN